MQDTKVRRKNLELQEMVVEASQALARLDADRLEELALSCQALNRDLAPTRDEQRTEMARQSREAAGDMAIFARVLDATRANLNVMSRPRRLHLTQLDYGRRYESIPLRAWSSRETENRHGND